PTSLANPYVARGLGAARATRLIAGSEIEPQAHGLVRPVRGNDEQPAVGRRDRGRRSRERGAAIERRGQRGVAPSRLRRPVVSTAAACRGDDRDDAKNWQEPADTTTGGVGG